MGTDDLRRPAGGGGHLLAGARQVRAVSVPAAAAQGEDAAPGQTHPFLIQEGNHPEATTTG